MAKQKRSQRADAATPFTVIVDEPPNGSDALVLDYRDEDDNYWYLICCHGYAQGLADADDVLKHVWARVYTVPLEPDSVPLTTGEPDDSDPDQLHEGEVDPNNETAFYFKGSQHGGNGLITLAGRPGDHPTQYLYVWAQRESDDAYAIPAQVIMTIKVAHRTHCNDYEP